jgi:hypothetical protein
MTIVCNILVEKRDAKRLLGIGRRRWEIILRWMLRPWAGFKWPRVGSTAGGGGDL